MSDKKKDAETYLSTGCTLLDLVVGGGKGLGFPAGKIVNIVGDKSSGKTFLAAEMVAKNVHTHGERFLWNYDDSETGFTFDTQGLYGVDLMHPETLLSSTVEELDGNVGIFVDRLKRSQLGIYVLDSLDGLSDTEKEEMSERRQKLVEQGKALEEKGSYGMGSAKFLSQHFFKTKTAKLSDSNALLVVISQVRENIGAGLYGKRHVRSGGKALDFYCHTVLWLANVSRIMKNDRQIGVVIEAKTEKSKTARPFRSCHFVVYFDYGVDNIGSNLDYLFDLRGKDGKLTKAAQKIAWGGSPSVEELKELLKREGLEEQAKEQKRKDTGNTRFSAEWVREWLEKGHRELYQKAIPSELSRSELIALIEESKGMSQELERRVIEKWEAEEAAIASDRRRKYE